MEAQLAEGQPPGVRRNALLPVLHVLGSPAERRPAATQVGPVPPLALAATVARIPTVSPATPLLVRAAMAARAPTAPHPAEAAVVLARVPVAGQEQLVLRCAGVDAVAGADSLVLVPHPS